MITPNKNIEKNEVVIIKDGIVFSSYQFYSLFLSDVAESYRKYIQTGAMVSYRLTDDLNPIFGRYRIDPISIPLLLCVSQQITKSQPCPIKLIISNFPATVNLLEFLYRADFFYISGDNINPIFPKGKLIFNYDQTILGGFSGNTIRPEHKVRCFSRDDDDILVNTIKIYGKDSEETRDRFAEHFLYKVTKHFAPILYEVTETHYSKYIEILSELITNGVIHSGSDVFALLFSDRYSTKLSIADNGKGFYHSLKEKTGEETPYYKKFELTESIADSWNSLSNDHKDSLYSIFEALYYSMIKQRVGLFDLMINVVNIFDGYFRLHNDCVQVIISTRMRNEIEKISVTRGQIRELYIKKDSNAIKKDEFDVEIIRLINKGKKEMIMLYNKTKEKYSEDSRFSSIRFFPIVFKGVHIEVEISK